MQRVLNSSKRSKYALDMIHKISIKSLSHYNQIIIPSQSTLNNKTLSPIYRSSKFFKHVGIKQKLMASLSTTKKRKLSIDSIKTIKGEHYNDNKCNVCDVSFPSRYQANEHILSTKHLKNLLSHYSDNYNHECIYCNIQFNDDISKQKHLSSIEHHTATHQILKQLKPSPSPSTSKSLTHSIDSNINTVHVKGLKGKHYTDNYCFVCDVSFDCNAYNISSHLNGSKHIKNVLASYSDDYHEKCIYCNALCNTPQLKHSHISSTNHSEFINSMINETRSKYEGNNEWIISMKECQNRVGNTSYNVRKQENKKHVPLQTVSATKLRKAIRDCYDDHSISSINQQLLLLKQLYKRSNDLNEKDYVSVLFCISSLMRTNNIDVIIDGIIKICKLFADDMDTLESSKWKMNHKLFEQIIDIIILSVNIKQLMIDFDKLMQQNENERDAFTALLGLESERKFLEPFSMFFDFFNDINKWNDNSFENNDAHKYFMKWSQLIFQDMMYNLRDIRCHQQINFDLNYKKLLRSLYGNIYYQIPIDINNTLEVRKYCSLTEKKRINSGPFTNITLSTPLEVGLSSLSKGSFVIMFPEDIITNIIDNKDVMVGYIYKMSGISQTVTVRIANHDDNIESDCRWHLLSMGASGASFESQFEALQKITDGSVATQLKSILYNDDKDIVSRPSNKKLIKTKLLSELNDSQRAAVDSALNNDITLVQGPPGTGKTHVAAAIVEQFLKQFKCFLSDKRAKILLSAYSNIAVDVLTERVLSNDLYPLRIGADSTLSPESQVLLNTHPVTEWSHKINWAEIICATSIGTANDMLKNTEFDLILIDETTQSTECGLLVALSKLKENGKIVLIGDHKQLPPTVCSVAAKYNGLDISLFERLIEEKDIKPNFLNTQYRMHPKLAEFPSIYFYDNNLLTGIEAKDRMIPDGFKWPVNDFPIAFVQTGDDAKESNNYMSRMNEKEAEIVVDIVTKLINNNNNNNQYNVTVISPYSAQKKLIDDNLFGAILSYDQRKRVKVRTVDGFQGSECDIIVFSATRCNDNSMLGFLKDYRRINVMLTRTKNGLIVVGDRDTLSNGDPLWKNWLKYVCDANKAIINHYHI